jgi:hypothetical protein
MALRFRYKLTRIAQPVTPLGGRWVRPRPLISVTVIGPADSRLRLGLVDTGADDTVFPESLAVAVGVDLTGAPQGRAAAANRGTIAVRYAQLRLRITDGVERREWPAWVAFTAVPINHPLLGFAGFLQVFSAHFHDDREEFELAVNSLYPGT